jgi:predicted SnoaL-like aldol condensation-catalyzing enzyme
VKKFFAAAALLGLVASGAQAKSLTERNRAVVQDFARIFYTEKDVERAFQTYVVADYIQHNPGIADRRQAAIDALKPKFSQPGA